MIIFNKSIRIIKDNSKFLSENKFNIAKLNETTINLNRNHLIVNVNQDIQINYLKIIQIRNN